MSYGEAVGVFILAMAMCDGVRVDAAQVCGAVACAATDCARGVPTEDIQVKIGYCITTVTGFTRAVAQGHF